MRPARVRSALLVLVAALLVGAPILAAAQAGTPAAPADVPRPPAQPTTGPGGAEAAFDRVVATERRQAPLAYWLFTPADPHPGVSSPASFPLVIFLHGFPVTDPAAYRAWIDHLVRRGAIVLFPDYQSDPSGTVDEKTFLTTLTAEVRAAIGDLGVGALPRADLNRVAVVGHSTGATLAVEYAAGAAAQNLPVPSALMSVAPGCLIDPCLPSDLSTIPASMRVLLVNEATDEIVLAEVQRLWAGLAALPADHKSLLVVQTDRHGSPWFPLLADHGQAFAGIASDTDALDWYGTWKWLDALMSCSFAGQDCQYAFGNTPEQRFMGRWSDGTPVKEAVVTQDPGTPTP